MSRACLCIAALALGACASESMPEPEPALDTPGAFVAVDGPTDPSSALELHRVLVPLYLETGTILFVSTYAVAPLSFDEARALAQEPALPLRHEIDFLALAWVESYPHAVVWYRSLTPEEEARIP